MKNRMQQIGAVAAVLVWLGWASPAPASVTYNFQPGVSNGLAASSSYRIDQASGRPSVPTGVLNADTTDYTHTGQGQISAFRFNLSAYNAPIGLESAKLTLWIANGATNLPTTWQIYALPTQNTNWSTTMATWNNQIQSSTTPWVVTGGTPTNNMKSALLSGVLIGSATASIPQDSVFPYSFYPVTFNLDTAVVDQWLTNPSGYAGFGLWETGTSFNGIVASYGYNTNGIGNSGAIIAPLLQLQIPEPAALALCGLGCLLFWRRRNR